MFYFVNMVTSPLKIEFLQISQVPTKHNVSPPTKKEKFWKFFRSQLSNSLKKIKNLPPSECLGGGGVLEQK